LAGVGFLGGAVFLALGATTFFLGGAVFFGEAAFFAGLTTVLGADFLPTAALGLVFVVDLGVGARLGAGFFAPALRRVVVLELLAMASGG